MGGIGAMAEGKQQQQQQQGGGPSKTQRALVDTLAGAFAGGVSRTMVSPLDVIKIRFQVQLEPTGRRAWAASDMTGRVSKYTGIVQATKDILREEGIRGFWRGNVPALLLVMPYTAIQFVVLQNFKSLVSGSTEEADHKHLSPSMSYLGGAIAGSAATIGSYPFDLLRTILACQGEPKVYANLRSALLDILRTKGVAGLYSGLTPSLVEIVPYAGLQFGSYDSLKRWTLAMNQWRDVGSADGSLSKLQNFVCGLGAGLFSKLCCHPLDVVKKRYQVEGLMRDPRYGARVEHKAYKNMWDAIKRIVAQEGWRGLYKGTLPSIVKAAPAAGITFFVYESSSDWLRSNL